MFCLVVLALPAPAFASAERARTPAAGSMVGKINKVRAGHGLRPLRTSRLLGRTSSGFARWLMRRGMFAHRARVKTSRRFRRTGEVLALRSGRGLAIGSTVRMWLSSPSHRQVILTRTMRWVGASAVRGRFRGRHATIWVVQTGRL